MEKGAHRGPVSGGGYQEPELGTMTEFWEDGHVNQRLVFQLSRHLINVESLTLSSPTSAVTEMSVLMATTNESTQHPIKMPECTLGHGH